MTDQDTWKSLDRGERPNGVRFGLYLAANNASEIVSESCPNLIDGVAAGMEGKAQLPEKATKDTQTALDYALHMGAGAAMVGTDVLDDFKNDSSTFTNWCATSSQGIACSDDKWQEILGMCSIQARSQAADAARYAQTTPSEAQLKTSRQRLFGACLSQRLYKNDSKAVAIAQKLSAANIDPITAAVAGSKAKAKSAKEMLEQLKSDLDDVTNSGGQEEANKTCGTEVTGIGWMMCPLLTAATGFADTMWKLFEGLLRSQPLSSDPSNHIYQTWSGFRNIANSLLIIAFLVVIYSQITSAGINNYGVKKMLPRIIIMAILINLSYFIVQITLDIANILGSSVLSFMENATDAKSIANLDETGWDGLIGMILGGGLAAGVTIGGTAIAASIVSIGPVLIFIALLLLPGLIAFLAGLVALMFRQALIPVIAILAPIAFAAYLFPNTQSLFDKWKKLFVGIVFLYPLAATYYGGLKLAAATIASDGQWFGMLMALTILFFGTGFVLYLALKSNAIVGKAMGAVQGVLAKVTNPIEKIGRETQKSMSAEGRARFMANSSGRKGIMGAIGRGMSSFDRAKRKRDIRGQMYVNTHRDNIDQQLASDPTFIPDDLKGTAAAQGVVLKMQEDRISNEEKLQQSLTFDEIKKISLDMTVSKDARVAAVRRVMKDGSAEDVLSVLEKSGDYGANSLENQALSAGVFSRGFQSVLGPQIGDEIIAGNIRSRADIDKHIIKNINKGMSAEALTTDATLTDRVTKLATNEAAAQQAASASGISRPPVIQAEKLVQLSEAADRVTKSETLSNKLKSDMPENIAKLRNL